MKTLLEFLNEAKSSRFEMANDLVADDVRKAIAKAKSAKMWTDAWEMLKEWLDKNATPVEPTEANYNSNEYHILLYKGTGGGRAHRGSCHICYKSTEDDKCYGMGWDVSEVLQNWEDTSAYDGITGKLRYFDHNPNVRNITDIFLYKL
jgi:hypothetical protein